MLPRVDPVLAARLREIARDPVVICLAVASAVSAAILLGLGSHLFFINEDWELLINRRGSSLDDFFDPFNEHIVFGPVVVYKLLLATFGMNSALPFQVVSIGLFVLSAVLLFIFARRRVGGPAALLGAILVLFLGAAFEDLLWPFQMGFFGSMAAGLGMLLALERDDARGDLIACILLALSLAFSSIGLVFAIGALVDLALSARPRVDRIYVIAVPLGLFLCWWVEWGHAADNDLSVENLTETPEYVINAAAAGITSLLGLATGDGSEREQPGLIWGQALLVAGVALAVFRLRQLDRIPRSLILVVAIALAFWTLAGLNQNPERLPTSSRYQYPSAIFLLLIAAEVMRGIRPGGRALMAGGVVCLAAALGGMALLEREYRKEWRPAGDAIRSHLAGVEIAGDAATPGYVVAFGASVKAPVTAYLDAVEENGPAGWSESELMTRSQEDKSDVDASVAAALGLELREAGTGVSGDCPVLGTTGLELAPGLYQVSNEGSTAVELFVGRFSRGYPVEVGELDPAAAASLTIPPDQSSVPWHIVLGSEGTVRICSTGPA